MSKDRYISKLERELASARHQILILKAKCAMLGDTGDNVLPLSPPVSLSSAATPCSVTRDGLQKSLPAHSHPKTEATELLRRPQQASRAAGAPEAATNRPLPMAALAPNPATTRRPARDSRAPIQQPSRAAWASQPAPSRDSARAAQAYELAITRRLARVARAPVQPPSRGAYAPESATTLQMSRAALAPKSATTPHRARAPGVPASATVQLPCRSALASKLATTRQPARAARASELATTQGTQGPLSAAWAFGLASILHPARIAGAPELATTQATQPPLGSALASRLATTQKPLYSHCHKQPGHFVSRLTDYRAKEAVPESNTMIPRPTMKGTTAKPRCSYSGRLPTLTRSTRSIQPESSSSSSAWVTARNADSAPQSRPLRLSDMERSSTPSCQRVQYLRSRRRSDRVSADSWQRHG